MEQRFPEELETERLYIRVGRPGDGKILNQAILESINELSPWLDWVTPAPTLKQSEEACRKAHARFLLNEDLLVFLFDKESGGLVGGSGLHDADWEKGQFETGYWGNTRYCGKGLVTEGVSALADYALGELRANRVFITTDERNINSWKLAERAGFVYEGTMRNERFDIEGKLRNTRFYSRIPD